MEIITTKVAQSTLVNAKKISEITGEKQYMAIDNAVRERLENLKKKPPRKNENNRSNQLRNRKPQK